MVDENKAQQDTKPASSLRPGLIGFALGAVIACIGLWVGVVVPAQQQAYDAKVLAEVKQIKIEELTKDRDGLLEDKTLYELNNTQNLALVAKLRGFCGKPCEGVK